MKLRSAYLPASLAGALAGLGCPGDDGSSGNDDAPSSGSSAGDTANPQTTDTGAEPTTMPNADTTAGPGPMTTTGVDTTAGSEDTTGGGPAEVHAFRYTEMFVRDPHFFVLGLGILCVDVTDSTPTGDPSINEQFNAAIAGDDPEMPDGNLDLNLMLIFRPLDQSDGATGPLDFANGTCEVPPTIECDIREGTNLDSTTYAVMEQGTCLAPDPSHLSSAVYNPQPGTTSGPCFVGDAANVTISTTDFDLPLSDAVIAAQFVDDPTNELVQGTLRGFLSTADAESIVLPMDVQMQTGATTISELLPGGTGNCAGHDDTDGDGWFMYVDFSAQRIPTWLGP